MTRRSEKPSPRRRLELEALEDRCVPAVMDFVFNVPANNGTDRLVLRKNGTDLEIFDKFSQTVVFDQPLADVNSLSIIGVDGEGTSLSIDFLFGGAFDVPAGVSFQGGLGRGQDTLKVIGTTSASSYTVINNLVQIDALDVTAQQLEKINFQDSGGNDIYALNRVLTQFAIKDTGGIDTLDFSAQTARLELKLNRSAGQTQAIGADNTLQLRGTLESVVGTDFDDDITGNNADNFIRGGDGDDEIHGGLGKDLILGELGDDTIHGEGGRDVLLGGMGLDLLLGGEAGDLMIANQTTFDANDATLNMIRSVWTSDLAYLTRIANLQATISGQVQEDNAVDVLQGNGGREWFLASPSDVLLDRLANERLN